MGDAEVKESTYHLYRSEGLDHEGIMLSVLHWL
jgi:hypothetical protein